MKVQIPILHRQFFRITSQNPENVERFCNDIKDPFQFACQKWISEKSSKSYNLTELSNQTKFCIFT